MSKKNTQKNSSNKRTQKTNKKKQKNQVTTTTPLTAWINQHRNSIKFSSQRLWLNPFSTWMTLAVIALALALPTGLHILLKNLSSVASNDGENRASTISLFLKPSVTAQRALDRSELLSERSEISSAKLITKDQAIENFKHIQGFKEILATIGGNPLPHVIAISPDLSVIAESGQTIEGFAKSLKNESDVDNVQIDLEWVQRLRAILNIAERVTLVIATLLGITVLLVVGNTIRLNISGKKREIEIIQLIGATNHYIRRPFLYEGVWYGFFGGILSLVIVHFSLLFIVAPVETLAKLYDSEFVISGVGIIIMLKLLFSSALLGLAGAWIAVGRHLQQQSKRMNR